MDLKLFWVYPTIMADIINLRQARKAKKRADHAAQGEANRLSFGRKKGERTATQKAKTQAKNHLDGHFLRPARDHESD